MCVFVIFRVCFLFFNFTYCKETLVKCVGCFNSCIRWCTIIFVHQKATTRKSQTHSNRTILGFYHVFRRIVLSASQRIFFNTRPIEISLNKYQLQHIMKLFIRRNFDICFRFGDNATNVFLPRLFFFKFQ